MELSIVIPAYNEANRLPRNLPTILSYLRTSAFSWEIIVVDDGSTDRTAELTRQTFGSQVRLLQHDRNRGKGAAVRTGMLAAQGRWRLLCDADLSTPIEELAKLQQSTDQAEVVIASRRAAGAKVVKSQAWWKVWFGQLGNIAIQLLVVPGIQDTRCGFKLFSERTNRLFELQRLERFGYDDEILFLARRHKFRIREVPVRWVNDEQTKVKVSDYFMTFAEIITIRLNDVRGLYK